MADGPLRGVRILDLTHVWAGPLATRVLADLGAEVVKIERALGRGTATPAAPPIAGWLGGEPGAEPWNANAAFVKLARNSRSVALDLKEPRGKSVFLELIAVADVVMENFSARAMPTLGLDYPALQAANPRIIYVTMPGYGTYGPYRDRVAFGPTVEAMSGITQMMGYGPHEPRNTAMALMDPTSGISATAAVVAALRRRETTGEGATIEMSLHEAGVAFTGPWLIDRQLGNDTVALGNRHPRMAPHGVYRCRGEDIWLSVACPDDTTWKSLCKVVGDLDPRLDFPQRKARQDDIDARISAWTAARTGQDAEAALVAGNIPCAIVNNTPQMTADPHVRERGFFVPLERDTPVPGNPVHMHGISTDAWTPCPSLGGHNAEVLRDWLGYDDERIEALRETAILADRPPV